MNISSEGQISGLMIVIAEVRAEVIANRVKNILNSEL